MSMGHPRLGSLGSSVFILNRTKILAVLSLILTWIIAQYLPIHGQSVRDTVLTNVNDSPENITAVSGAWHPEHDAKAQFNSSRLALIIEGRPLRHLLPQLLHMMYVVPADWRFMFIGSNQSVTSVRRSFATQFHEQNGKLDVLVMPEPWSLGDKEHVYRMLTDMRFYDEFLPGVEHLLQFESDSIMCANSADSLNDWLEYDWAAASRTLDDRYATNGGLSLRRVKTIKQILGSNKRQNDTEPEDQWFTERVVDIPGANIANAKHLKQLSVGDIWRERPLGFHVRDGGQQLADAVWKDPKRRRAIFDYCPELAMIMPMKLERERCASDNKEGITDSAIWADNGDRRSR